MTNTLLVLALFGTIVLGQHPQPDCVPAVSRPGPIGPELQTSRGPPVGSLIIAGGALTDPSVYQRFYDLSTINGETRIVYVPTNSGNDYPTEESRRIELESFARLSGLPIDDMVLVHTRNRTVADSDEFIAPILQATGVYFAGGRPTHSVDFYLNTQAQKAFETVLARGGCIGGSSAGASLQGDPLIRGDTPSNRVVLGDHRVGFAYVTNVGIDQHFLPRNRHNDLIEAISAYPDMLGVAIDEDTAIEFHGDIFTVIGATYVTVYDKTLWPTVNYCGNFVLQGGPGRPVLSNMGKYFFLKVGDSYNVRTRQITSFAVREDDTMDF